MNVQDIRDILKCAYSIDHDGSGNDTKSGILAAANVDIAFERHSALYLISVGLAYTDLRLIHLYSSNLFMRVRVIKYLLK